jgi:hypothetical protein
MSLLKEAFVWIGAAAILCVGALFALAVTALPAFVGCLTAIGVAKWFGWIF